MTDTQGSPLPGVTITVTSPQMQGSRTEVTDSDGKYNIPSLPPGTYRAEYTLSGAQTAVREGITVHAGTAPAQNVQLSLSVSETVTVTASQVVVDPTQAATQHTMDEDHLKYTTVGSANRSYQNVLQQAPGVAGGANPNVAGANLAQNDWYVDGVNTTDPVTHTFGGNMAFDAIQEITLLTFGKDAEYKSSGGTVNVITKSGGNEFSGSFDYRYNDPDFLTEGKETRDQNPSTGAYYGGPVSQVLRFNKGAQTDKSEQPQATLGGPIMRDKLWFFAATHRPETSRQAPNLFGFQPGVRAFTGWNTHGKLTFTPWANQTLTGKFTDSHALVTNTNDSSFIRPEADAQQFQKSRIYALAYDAVLSSKWLANLQVSHRPAELSSFPMSNDIDTIGVNDTPTGIRSFNHTNTQGRTSERNEILASTTYYLERFGTHAFKIGANLDHNEFTSFNHATGHLDAASNRPANAPTCAQLIAQHGLPAGSICTAIGTSNVNAAIPFRLTIGIRNPPTTKEADLTSFFVQDEWRPIPRLTARLGIRYDATTWGSSNGNPVPDFELLQPRVGLAYDVFNNASTVIHAYGGKIGDENQLTLPNFGVIEPAVSLRYNQNTAGQFVFDPNFSTVALTGFTFDPDLRQSYSNQYSFGITQRVFRNTSIDVTAERRTQHDLFEDYGCKLTTALAGGECDFFMTNNPGADAGVAQPLRSRYDAVITKIETRPMNWLDMTLSWTHSKSRASTTSTQNQDGSFDFFDDRPCNVTSTPANGPTGNCFHDFFTNTYGYTGDDARDRIKFNGYARLPWNFIVGAAWQWDSGQAWSVVRTIPPPINSGTLFLEPRGSRRLPHFHQLDLQLQKDFNIRNFRFGLIGSVFNVLSTEIPLTINGNAGTRARWNDVTDPSSGLFIDPDQVAGPNRLSPTFGQYTSWQRPRRYEVGVRFEF
ncbi:MAG TPA: TonB-dependent receptor [Thermoanaerobaculia bacterium]|nr:TonB-dependent receptor [Thermoanaerobaculia bacterium]